jgi:alkylated DNA nucleotide flippase Atl1
MLTQTNSPENLKQQLLYEVNKIPAGKVLSYGEVGAKVGISGWIAGRILSGMTDEEMKNYAWQRVVNKQGYISALKLGFRGNLQIELLRAEGVEIPETTVDMKKYTWVE